VGGLPGRKERLRDGVLKQPNVTLGSSHSDSSI
jgi:hypothetical protein